MKTFRQLISEIAVDPIYDKKKVEVDAGGFKGHAHINFSKSIGKRSNVTHEYRVTYKGNILKPNGNEPYESSQRLIVRHGPDGKPYEHSINGKKSSSIVKALQNAAPTWVHLKDLEPKK